MHTAPTAVSGMSWNCSAMRMSSARRGGEMKDECKSCGFYLFDINPGKGPHAAALHCNRCGRFHRWLSKKEYVDRPAYPKLVVADLFEEEVDHE
jgi:ribosomal protein L37E